MREKIHLLAQICKTKLLNNYIKNEIEMKLVVGRMIFSLTKEQTQTQTTKQINLTFFDFQQSL